MKSIRNTARKVSFAARFFSFFRSNKWRLLFVSVPLLTLPFPAQRWIFANLGTPVRYVTSSYDAFGLMIKANNGNILNFYREGTTHAGDRGVMMLKVSTDNGTAWTYFSGKNYCQQGDHTGCLFSDSTYDSRNGAGGITPAGTIVLFWNTFTSQVGYYSRSTDNGASWSVPARVRSTNPSNTYSVSYGPLVVVPKGRAKGSCSGGCIAGVFYASNNGHACLVFSYDDGVTWTDAKDIKYSNGMRIPTYEAALLWAGGDQLIGFDRPGSNVPYLFLYSSNLGDSWTINPSNIAATPLVAGETLRINGQSMVSPWLIQPGLPDGSVTLLISERQMVTGGSSPVHGYLRAVTFKPQDAIRNAGNNPVVFGTAQMIFAQGSANSGVDFGYPSAVRASGTTWLIEFYAQPSLSGVPNLYTMTAQYKTLPAD